MRKYQARQGVLAMALAAALGASAGSAALAGAVIVDGSVADWGITVHDGTVAGNSIQVNGNTVTFNTNSGVGQGTDYGTLASRPTGFQVQDGVEGTKFGMPGDAGNAGTYSEDFFDGTNTGLVDPNFGGQDYDAEWMGTALSGNTLFLAILSGQRADNGLANYSPGDIRIVAKSSNGTILGEYGIEVSGATYVLNGGGVTQSVLQPGASGCTTDGSGTYGINAGQTAGSVYRTDSADWIKDPIASSSGISAPGNDKVQIGCGADKIGAVQLVQANAGGSHAVIEAAINLSLFGSFAELDIYWGPACGNDKLGVEWPHEQVPAPAGVLLLASALAGFAALRRRQLATKP